MSGRAGFLSAVRTSLGPSSIAAGRQGGADSGRTAPPPVRETGLSVPAATLFHEADQVRAVMARNAGPLLDSLADSARSGGWAVTRAQTHEDAAETVADICLKSGVKSVLRSAEDIFDRVPVERTLAAAGISVRVMARPHSGAWEALRPARTELRQAAFTVDAGITGGDYAVAETGTLAVHPRRGLSRLISLVPPRHIAIIERGQVLPSLDELFVLEREALLRGELRSSMNLISGPSRTGDIEGTIVYGIHGPLETHLVLVG